MSGPSDLDAVLGVLPRGGEEERSRGSLMACLVIPVILLPCRRWRDVLGWPTMSLGVFLPEEYPGLLGGPRGGNVEWSGT